MARPGSKSSAHPIPHRETSGATSEVSEASDGAAADVMSLSDEVLRTGQAMRGALGRLHGTEDAAWVQYMAETDEAVARMEADLTVSAARLRAERSASNQELKDALDLAADTIRGRADEIRVQLHLGEMDARDAVGWSLAELEGVGKRIAALTESVVDGTTHGAEGLRERAHDLFTEVRSALGGIGVAMRRDSQ